MTSLFTSLTARVALDVDLSAIATSVGIIVVLLTLAVLVRREYLRAQRLGKPEQPRDRLAEVPLVPLLPVAGLIIIERLLLLLR